MAHQTGENEQALRKILDMTRMISLVFLGLHFYYYCYAAFSQWEIVSSFTDRLLHNVAATGLFSSFLKSKVFALGFLAISLLGSRGKKNEKLQYKNAFTYIAAGLLVYFSSYYLLLIKLTTAAIAVLYFTVTISGYLLVLKGGTILSRIIKDKLKKDIFNLENETFP